MLKKALLTTVLSLSTLATAQINLDLNLTLRHQDINRDTSGSVAVDEGTAVSVVFNDFESLAFDLLTNRDGDDIIVQVQILQRNENNDVVEITNPLAVRVPFGQPATITVNEESPDVENNGSLVLVITPTLVE